MKYFIIFILLCSCSTIEFTYDPESGKVTHAKKLKSGKILSEKFYDDNELLIRIEKRIKLDTIYTFEEETSIEIVDVVVTCYEINYYPNGKIKNKGNYILGSRSGKWKLYSPQGKLIKTEFY